MVDKNIMELTNELPTIGPKGEWIKKIQAQGVPGDTLYQTIGKDYVRRFSMKNGLNEPAKERIDTPETIEGISYRYTKHAPWWWLNEMRDSPFVKAGLPGINSRVDDAKLTIEGKDAIRNSPPMCECTWQELFEARREGFLIIIIKNYLTFNEKYEYLKR
jgi:hypothetical protein